MTSDGGGWYLFITLHPQGAAAATPQDWPTTVAIIADVESTGMFGGNFVAQPSRVIADKTLASVHSSGLSQFSEVKEEIASGLVDPQGIGAVVDQYGFLSRTKQEANRPSCQYDLEDDSGATVMRGCAESGVANSLSIDR